MSQETINKSLQKTLLSPLTHDLLWSQFLESFSYELQNMRDKYSTIKNNWDVNKNDKSNLIRISESFGYTPNLIINNTIDMSKREIDSIPYRIREKTTYDGYYLIFQQNNSKGEVFNYYWNGYKLVKVIDYEKTSDNLNNSNHYSPFCGIETIKNYSNLINSSTMILDYDGFDKSTEKYIFSLDQIIGSSYWKLDTPYIQTPTKHLGIDYFPEQYYCKYRTSLGIATEDEEIYECQIQISNYYIPKSMIIYVNNTPLETTINVLNDKEFFTDDNGILNENSYFDTKENLVHLEFNEIPSDYEISIVYNINLLMTSDYFYYLEQGMEYNRRCPIVPHNGIFLSADIAQSRGSDFYFPNDEHYTIPDLKIKAITTSAYNRNIILNEPTFLDNAMDSEGHPSGKDNYKLDSSIKWFLDTSTIQNNPIFDEIHYIACGNKALNIIDEENNQIFNQNSIICYYNLNTDNDSFIIKDISLNSIDCEVVGDIIKIPSVIDKSLNFNGETYAHSSSYLTVDSSKDYTFGMWFKINSTDDYSIGTLFDSFINISYDYENHKLLIDSNEVECSENNYHFLTLFFNKDTSSVEVYIDHVLASFFAFSILSSSLPIYIGTDSSETNNFYGEIDNLWLLDKIITFEEMLYIYNNKISVISHMGNRLAYYNIYDDEKYEDDNYLIVQSYVKSMDINNENIILHNDPSDETEYFSSQTNFYPIIPSYFYMNYTNSVNKTVTIQSNERGDLYNKETGEIITGDIDFKNGKWKLAKNIIKSISQKVIDSPEKKEYNNVYYVKLEDETDGDWYEHKNLITEEFTDKINADEFESSDLIESEFIYKSEDDKTAEQSQIFIYSNDAESYYIPKGTVGNRKIPIAEYTANADENENPLFSFDNGKTLYTKLSNLVNGYNTVSANDRIHLRAFSDMGEATGTTLYTISNFVNSGGYANTQAIYLNVNALCVDDSSMRVRKWNLLLSNDEKTIGYTLGNIDENELTSNKFYSNLSFTSEISNIVSVSSTNPTFTPMYTIIKDTQIDLNLTLFKSTFEWRNLTAINYIKSISTKIEDENIKLVKNSITFDYWLKENDRLVKYTATIDANGGISGENISSGYFDYETNAISVEFFEEVNSDIPISYKYYDSLDLDYTKPLIMNYKIEKSIKVNEIGLENENHELVAYMTFPDVEFNTIYDNLSAMFAIRKS